jgi:hypothetical protein
MRVHQHFNPSRKKPNLFYLNLSPYRTVNTLNFEKRTNKLILYRAKFAVHSEIHTKYINTLQGQNAEFLLRPGVR